MNFQSQVDSILAQELETEKLAKAVENKKRLIADFSDGSNYTVGDVIGFQKQFDNKPGITYTYVAVLAHNDTWYTTSRWAQPMTWSELVLWLVSGDNPTTQTVHLGNVLDSLNVFSDVKRGSTPFVDHDANNLF